MKEVEKVRIDGGTLHINNKARDGEVKYLWEKTGHYKVSRDGLIWENVINVSNFQMDD